jgi:hypothetical protein
MNQSCEMWSRPWHALQKNLAAGIGGDLLESSALVWKAADVRGLVQGQGVQGQGGQGQGGDKVSGFAVSAKSWLSRVQHRTPVATQVRQ